MYVLCNPHRLSRKQKNAQTAMEDLSTLNLKPNRTGLEIIHHVG